MAIAIKSIPTLKGEDAKTFIKKADKAFGKRATIDFSKQIEMSRAILKKAKML